MKLLFALIPCLAIGCGTIGSTPDVRVGKSEDSGPVARTFNANSEKFAACGRDSVTIQTGTDQNLKLRFTVDENGKVTKATVENIHGPDPDLQSCVVRTLRKLEFPAPHDGKPKEVTHHLALRPE